MPGTGGREIFCAGVVMGTEARVFGVGVAVDCVVGGYPVKDEH